MRRFLPLTLFLVSMPGACSQQEPERVDFVPECDVNQFRACSLDACVGAQQCVEPGIWTECHCTVLDASYADAAQDGGDAADGGDAEDGGEGDADAAAEDS